MTGLGSGPPQSSSRTYTFNYTPSLRFSHIAHRYESENKVKKTSNYAIFTHFVPKPKVFGPLLKTTDIKHLDYTHF